MPRGAVSVCHTFDVFARGIGIVFRISRFLESGMEPYRPTLITNKSGTVTDIPSESLW